MKLMRISVLGLTTQKHRKENKERKRVNKDGWLVITLCYVACYRKTPNILY